MPVPISVSQVREALYRAEDPAGSRGEGAASTADLGRWFHEALGLLVQDRGPRSPLRMMAEGEESLEAWKETLVAQMYAQFVGPLLTQQQSTLHQRTSQVLSFWQAIQAACEWVADMAWQLAQTRQTRRGELPVPWKQYFECIRTEEQLRCEIRAPDWTDSVCLTGIADAVVRRADTGAWCAIEFKLGQTCPAVDLGQACLYYLILSSSSGAEDHLPAQPVIENLGTLALVSFLPERHEQLFTAEKLQTAKQRLVDLIGKLAGVLPTIPPPIAPRLVQAQPSEEHQHLGRELIKTLAEYRVNVDLEDSIVVGPTFLRFPVRLGRGMKVAAVEGRAAELQVRLGLNAEPFISRTQGQLVIDVQRPDRQTIYFKDVRSQIPTPPPGRGGSHLPVGVDLAGKLVCADLSQPAYSHFLAAGTTGSGKSEWLRLAIAGLLVTNTPETLRLLVIDPKRNAFHALRNSPFLWKPLVFPDEQPAASVLAELAEEMDRRYRILDGADSIAHLAERTGLVLPRIVCICDEYRDLISRSKEERKAIEQQICRLGVKARAAGIHLILATQEPSRETVKGALDSNIPARVGLKMSKNIESKMLLGVSGAENLLGHGDLIFRGEGGLCRLQAPLLDADERERIFGET